MLTVLICIHVVSILIAIGAGARVLRDLLNGAASRRRCILFLRFSLVSNMIGLIFPVDGQVLSIRLMSMICIYVSGMVALSWRYFRLRGAWRTVFAASLTVVFGMDVQIVLYRFLHSILPLAGLSGPGVHSLALAIENVVAVAYFALAAVAAFRCRTGEA